MPKIDPIVAESVHEVLLRHGQGSGLQNRIQKLLENIVTGNVTEADILEIIDTIKVGDTNGH